jgi:hypothetical protein
MVRRVVRDHNGQQLANENGESRRKSRDIECPPDVTRRGLSVIALYTKP